MVTNRILKDQDIKHGARAASFSIHVSSMAVSDLLLDIMGDLVAGVLDLFIGDATWECESH